MDRGVGKYGWADRGGSGKEETLDTRLGGPRRAGTRLRGSEWDLAGSDQDLTWLGGAMRTGVDWRRTWEGRNLEKNPGRT